MGVLSDAAEKLGEVNAKIAAIDFSQEKEKVSEAIGATQVMLSEVEASLRGYIEQFGEPSSVPQAGEVANPAEPFEGAETTPEEGADVPEGATEIENEPGAE